MFKPNEWEGRGFKYAVKYLMCKYPQMLLPIPFYLVVVPICLVAAGYVEKPFYNFDGRERPGYRVIRHDDPRIKYVRTLDYEGNEYRPPEPVKPEPAKGAKKK